MTMQPHGLSSWITPTPWYLQVDITPHTMQSANATHQDKIQLKMLQILERIDSKLDDKNDNRRTKSRRVVDYYCWTHGAGNHKSGDCRNKKDGHKDNANFGNRMGGSDAYCKMASKSK